MSGVKSPTFTGTLADFTRMTAPKSQIDKAISAAEKAVRELEALEVDDKVAEVSLYWAKYSARNALKYLRDCSSEDSLQAKDFLVFTSDEDGFRIVSDPEEKWKLLHNVQEVQDDKARPWLRALRG